MSVSRKRGRTDDDKEASPSSTTPQQQSATTAEVRVESNSATPPAVVVASSDVQRIDERSDTDKVVRNSPYGADRPKLGWGNVFTPPKKCFSESIPQVFIGLSSLNAVPAVKQREMPPLLTLYMKKFHCLEHCATYHRVNERPTWEKWRDMPGKKPFTFTVKCNEYLTHTRCLEMDDDTMSHINTFFRDRCAALGNRLGAVLLQLPPSFKYSDRNVDRIKAISAAIPPEINIAVELRHKSWFKEEFYELLRQIRWTLVTTHNEDIGESPHIDTGTNIMYVRLHGAVAKFVGDYGTVAMRRWAEKVYQYVAADPTRRKVFFFMNNNESHVNHETSSVVDATCFAEHLQGLIKANPFPAVPTATASTVSTVPAVGAPETATTVMMVGDDAVASSTPKGQGKGVHGNEKGSSPSEAIVL